MAEAAPLVFDALDRAPQPEGGTAFTIADYGTADGGTSMVLLKDCVDRLRATHGPELPVMVQYEDQPVNDWTRWVGRAGTGLFSIATNAGCVCACVRACACVCAGGRGLRHGFDLGNASPKNTTNPERGRGRILQSVPDRHPGSRRGCGPRTGRASSSERCCRRQAPGARWPRACLTTGIGHSIRLRAPNQ